MASTFHLSIQGDLEDFISFCALVHAGLADEAAVKQLIARLKTSETTLAAAEATIPPVSPPPPD